eukprot:7335954-Lingulodinium_polyedra.AAC.1
MLPPGSQRMSLRWFDVLIMLSTLRSNYAHFNHGALPAWAQRDALLAQRIETLAMLTTAFDRDVRVPHLQTIFDPFQL